MAMIKKREQGFTLVELLVGMAIMALVGVAVFGILSSSVRTYQYGVSDENSFNQVRGTLSAITAELRYDATVNAPAAGITDNHISYVKSNGEACTIALGADTEAGNIVVIKPGSRLLHGHGTIQAVSFTRAADNSRRITVTLTVSNNAGGVASTITLSTDVWTGSI